MEGKALTFPQREPPYSTTGQMFMFHFLAGNIKKYPTEWPEVTNTLKNPDAHTERLNTFTEAKKGQNIRNVADN